LLILNCKYAEETSNCTAAWKFIFMVQNVQCWRKQKELLLNGENLIALPELRQRNFSATDKKFENLC
jgi:hypothetical protein